MLSLKIPHVLVQEKYYVLQCVVFSRKVMEDYIWAIFAVHQPMTSLFNNNKKNSAPALADNGVAMVVRDLLHIEEIFYHHLLTVMMEMGVREHQPLY